MSARKKWNKDLFSDKEELIISKISKYSYHLDFDTLIYLTDIKERQRGIKTHKNIKVVHDLKFQVQEIKRLLKLHDINQNVFIEKIIFDDFYYGYNQVKAELELISLSVEQYFENIKIELTPEAIRAFKEGYESSGKALSIESFD